MDRGKVLWEEDLEKLKGKWSRYKDIDGDGIPYRTVPGNQHPASGWLGRGTGHNEEARYTEDSETWESNMERLGKKYETARSLVPKPEILDSQHEAALLCYGSTSEAVREALSLLAGAGLKCDLLRIRALPCTEEVKRFLDNHNRIYVVEANRDGQLREVLSAAVPDHCSKLRSICHSDGLPLTARWIVETIQSQED
jgi:2-oxoglutarate ferredoxin oxidoreductase subunit alpha